jgi:thiol-disulfide isomerase/thioredoxin
MKKLFFLLTALALVSCKQEAPEYTLVTGSIANGSVEQITVNTPDREVKSTFTVNADGKFSDTLRIDQGTYYLIDGRNTFRLHVEHGKDVNISYDVNDLNGTLTFTGEGAPVNTYLHGKGSKESEMMGSGADVYILEEDAYKARMNEIKTALTELLEGTEGIDAGFAAQEKRSINYAYLNKLSIFERYHRHYAQKPEFEVSEAFLAELSELDYNNEEDYKASTEYKQLVQGQYSEKIVALYENEEVPYELASLQVFGAIENEYIRNDLMYGSAKFSITYTEDLEKFYALFMEKSTNEEHRAEIEKIYKDMLKVAKGQPSPKFVDYENFAGGTASLDDYKGKYVYIDVWATWCGPCKREIPYLKELEKKYHGRNIEIISMSIDRKEDYDKWRTMVEEEELGGVQLFADSDWSSQFVQDYMIKGIPRFILVDPEGNIVTPNAPRPSNESLVELFDELNI